MKYFKQIKIEGLAVFLGLSMVLTGCQGIGSSKEKVVMGRYLEEKINIEGIKEEEELEFFFKDHEGNIEVMSCKEGEQGIEAFRCYTPDKDDIWKETDTALCKSMVSEKFIYIKDILMNQQSGDRYVMVGKEEKRADKKYPLEVCYIKRVKESGTLEDIPVEWKAEEMYCRKAVIDKNQIYVLGKDMTSAERPAWSIQQYDLKTGKLIKEIGKDIEDFALINDKIYAVINDDKNMIDIYDIRTGERTSSIESAMKSYAGEMLAAEDQKGVYFIGREGIYYLADNGQLMEQVIDGRHYNLSVPSAYIRSVIMQNGVFYILYRGDDGNTCMKYTYHKELPMVSENKLTIFSLERCEALQGAAQIYREKHPDVDVEVNVINFRGDTLDEETKNQAVQAINTQILAGEMPDIIVLDGLPMETYMKKGILGDMSEILTEIEKKHHYYEQLMHTCEQDGKIYALPALFNIVSAVGSKELISDGFSLEKLADYQREHPNERVLGSTAPEELLQKMSSFWQTKLIDSEGRMDHEQLKLFLESIHTLAPLRKGETDCYESKWANQGDRTVQAMNKEIKATLEDMPNTEQLEVMLHAKVQWDDGIVAPNIEGQEEMIALHQLIGISAKSKQKEGIQELISYAYGETEKRQAWQDFTLEEDKTDAIISGEYAQSTGRAGRKELVKNMDISFGYTNAQGEMDIKDYPRLWYADEAQYYIDKLKTVKAIKPMDSEILKVLQKESEGYFKGEISVDEAIQHIEEKVNLYLIEQNKQ